MLHLLMRLGFAQKSDDFNLYGSNQKKLIQFNFFMQPTKKVKINQLEKKKFNVSHTYSSEF
jgi:hypothetical protein